MMIHLLEGVEEASKLFWYISFYLHIKLHNYGTKITNLISVIEFILQKELMYCNI
jgi:hypothetical protein